MFLYKPVKMLRGKRDLRRRRGRKQARHQEPKSKESFQTAVSAAGESLAASENDVSARTLRPVRGNHLHGFAPALKCEARAACEKITLRALAIIKFVHPARVEIEMVVLT